MSYAALMVVTTTFDEVEKAREVSRLMVDAGLAVCAQVEQPMQSFYRWKGEIISSGECRVTFKVLGDRFDLFCGELKLNHPYDVPQLVAWPADYVDHNYLEWAKGKSQ